MKLNFRMPEPDSHERTGFWPDKEITKVGESIEGVYLGETEYEVSGKDAKAIGILLDGEESPILVSVNSSLGDELDEVYPPLRSRIRVTWIGEKETGRGNPMRLYKLELAVPTAAPTKKNGK
jgi:hypothetical protein